MKMKHAGLMAAACTASFVVGTFVSLPKVHAQETTSSRTFYVVDYMKSRMGQDPIKLERDLWKPLHQDRLKNGDITSWAVMEPVLAGPHNYDYITVTGYSSMEAYARTEARMRSSAEKIWGKDKLQSSMAQTEQTRDMLGSEMYMVVDSIGR